MTPRLLAAAVALAAGLSACAATPSPAASFGADAPEPVDGLGEVARFGLLFTEGEPLIDPAELIDAAAYDGIPSLDRPEVDARLPAFVRVAGVTFGEQSQAWSYDALRRRRVVEATLDGQPLVVLWARGARRRWRPTTSGKGATWAAAACTTPAWAAARCRSRPRDEPSSATARPAAAGRSRGSPSRGR